MKSYSWQQSFFVRYSSLTEPWREKMFLFSTFYSYYRIGLRFLNSFDDYSEVLHSRCSHSILVTLYCNVAVNKMMEWKIEKLFVLHIDKSMMFWKLAVYHDIYMNVNNQCGLYITSETKYKRLVIMLKVELQLIYLKWSKTILGNVNMEYM